MKTEEKRICSICGNEFSGAVEFCPVCMLRKALAGGVKSGESSFQEAVRPTPEQPAHRFEHYELVTDEDGKPVELGRGAMGVTYKALDVDLHYPVTLKVISERYLGDESARLRFLREARAAARLRHSNVASVLHLGRTGNSYFYAMEFVEGETLENLIKRSGRLEVKLALEIATQVAAGLAAVHEQHLVHRDIKPTNIMVNLKEEGGVTAKIIDLGLAKTLDESASETGISSPGTFVGTPEFASPEQFGGVGVDIRSDLYSLGVTLWVMVTGQTPFRGTSAEVMHQHQHAPLPVEQLNGIPQPLVVLLEVLLAKDPARRFQTPAELLKVMPTVRDAINAGRAMMKTIRVFVSSTGDVQKERHVAERVMCAIAAEFNLPVSESYSIFQRLAEENGEPEKGEPKTEPDNHSPLVLCPYFLEHQRLQLDAGFLGVMPNTAEFDLVICILWSRLGSLLAPSLRMPDGSAPASGTDCEIGWALDHASKNRGVPQLRVYRNCSKPTPPLEPKEEREAFGRQWDSVQEFFARWEANSEGDFAGEHAPIFHGRTRAIGRVLVDKQWAERGGAIGRWSVRVRSSGARAAELEFIPFLRPHSLATASLPALWDRAATASRRMAERFAASAGGVGQIYDEKSTVFNMVVKEYLLAWAALLEEAQPLLGLVNTVEVQSLSGRTIGLIVLPSHPLRVAWLAAYDNLVLHAAFDQNMKPRDIRDEFAVLDGAMFPAFLPGLENGSSFVFADTLGFHTVGMVPDIDKEPKAALAILARALGESEAADAVPTVGKQSATILGNEVVKYLECHNTARLLHIHALRPGDGFTVARALGRVHEQYRKASSDQDLMKLHRIQRLDSWWSFIPQRGSAQLQGGSLRKPGRNVVAAQGYRPQTTSGCSSP